MISAPVVKELKRALSSLQQFKTHFLKIDQSFGYVFLTLTDLWGINLFLDSDSFLIAYHISLVNV